MIHLKIEFLIKNGFILSDTSLPQIYGLQTIGNIEVEIIISDR